jgi:hypothetical protein
MSDARRIVQKFSHLDFHDDALKYVKISSIQNSRSSVVIDFGFQDGATRASKVLSFRGCANVRYSMDFDVTASNWFAQTEGAVCTADIRKMRRFIQAQHSHWRVKYMPPNAARKPIQKKLAALREYLLFKFKFFGGTVEILAQRFTLRCARTPASKHKNRIVPQR